MCGLVGSAGNLTAKDDTTIKRLLMLDYFRGPDSTGLASIRLNGEARIAKAVGAPTTLFQHYDFKYALEGITKCFIGHNRATTIGGTNEFNAHPFKYGDIVGAHNGTLDAVSWTRLQDALGYKTNVDSQALIACINKLGIEETISLCTTGSDPNRGAWSLVWFDFNDNSLNFLRNKHRPMWYAWDKDYKRLYWASEWWMLQAAGYGDGIDFAEEGDQKLRFFPTDEDTWYRFDVGAMITASSRQKPKVKKVKGREPVVTPVATSGTIDPFGRDVNVRGFQTPTHSSTTSTTTSRGSTTSSPDRSTSSGNYLQWWGTTAHPYAGYIEPETFEKLARHGCTWCSKTVEYGDKGITIFEKDELVLCAKCSGHDELPDDAGAKIYVTPTEFVKLK